ncbi:MAG: VWA domain-containing protein [Acidobacteriota bacterium]|nr:VWA domain-containing protein [Acidobacteriota bacterium]MDQ7088743.1 VWA domain-containing protein [Acidobacteriota bacterium]
MFGGEEPVDQERARRLMQRVASGGARLSDEEFQLVMAASHTDEVEVELVMVTAVVVDRRSRPLTGLEREDFQLFDDGQPRPLAWFGEELAAPFRLVLLLDVSGSMADRSRTAAIRAALLPLMRQVRRRDRVRLVSFADRGVQVHGSWSARPLSLLSEALSIQRRGRTALADALAAAAALLAPSPLERQAIVLVSDGLDNASRLAPAQAAAAALEVAAPVYVLALGGPAREIQARRNPQNPLAGLREVARLTGGRFFLIGGEEELSRARAAARQIRDDLRHQYRLAFRPAPGRRQGAHRIEVRVHRRGARVLARRGYR